MEWLESKGGSLYDQSLKFEENVSKLGAYACFCEYQMNNLMRPVDTEYKIEYKDVNGTMQEMSEPICRELDNYNGIWLAYGYYLCIFLSVQAVLNILYYLALPQLLYNTRTMEVLMSFGFVVALYLLAYAFVPIIATFGIGKSGFFPQMYAELTAQWYQDIGILVCKTMIYNIFLPPIVFLSTWLFCRKPCRYYDQGWNCNFKASRTQSKTLVKFVQIYSGPQFYMDYAYAYLVYIVFMTFLYAPGIPILFFLALLALISFYVTESLAMAYAYTKPVMYDERIHEYSVSVLSFAPIIYCLMGAWVYSN